MLLYSAVSTSNRSRDEASWANFFKVSVSCSFNFSMDLYNFTEFLPNNSMSNDMFLTALITLFVMKVIFWTCNSTCSSRLWILTSCWYSWTKSSVVAIPKTLVRKPDLFSLVKKSWEKFSLKTSLFEFAPGGVILPGSGPGSLWAKCRRSSSVSWLESRVGVTRTWLGGVGKTGAWLWAWKLDSSSKNESASNCWSESGCSVCFVISNLLIWSNLIGLIACPFLLNSRVLKSMYLVSVIVTWKCLRLCSNFALQFWIMAKLSCSTWESMPGKSCLIRVIKVEGFWSLSNSTVFGIRALKFWSLKCIRKFESRNFNV